MSSVLVQHVLKRIDHIPDRLKLVSEYNKGVTGRVLRLHRRKEGDVYQFFIEFAIADHVMRFTQLGVCLHNKIGTRFGFIDAPNTDAIVRDMFQAACQAEYEHENPYLEWWVQLGNDLHYGYESLAVASFEQQQIEAYLEGLNEDTKPLSFGKPILLSRDEVTLDDIWYIEELDDDGTS